MLLGHAGAALAAMGIATAGGVVMPAAARAQGAPLARLSAEEAATLEALGDTLLPGAAEAGIAHFVDDQLGRERPLLTLVYLDYPDPFADFYRQGLAALDGLSRDRLGTAFATATVEQQTALVGEVAAGNPAGWSAPVPSGLFYFVVRGDAVDVVYGTVEGFATLSIPYMEHILPPERW
jgi:hypothetical protein